MTKAVADAKDVYQALLAYRNSPQNSLDTSPVQSFLGRRMRTNLPTTATILLPGLDFICQSQALAKKAETAKDQCDGHVRQLHPI